MSLHNDNALVVALDTSTDMLACAASWIDGQTGETKLVSGDHMCRRHANVELVNTVDGVLAQAGLDRSDVGCYVVGRGPGSFTGVRIGISTAKGLARGANVPLLGVSTLDACAWTAWKAGVRGKLGILADAMRGEVYPALYMLVDEGPERQFEREHVVKAAVALDEWRQAADWGQVQLTGDGLVRYGKLLGEDEAARCVERDLWWPSGEGLLLAHAAGDGDPARVLPIYTRLSDAEENERKRLGLAESAQSEITGVADELAGRHLQFRPMGAADAEGASALEAACFEGAGHKAWTPGMFLSELGEDVAAPRSWWVAHDDGKLLGLAGGMVVDGDVQILDVAVDPAHRREGIARKLLSHVSYDAQMLGCTTASLEVEDGNEGATALYNALGFTEAGRRRGYYGAGKDAIVMTAPLPLVLPVDNASPEPTAAEQRVWPLPAPGRSEGERAEIERRRLVLAIESSCDETAVAIIDADGNMLANQVSTQIDFHARFGGVVPEIASRKHVEVIVSVVDAALEDAAASLGLEGGAIAPSELAAVGVTQGPGLVGALVVGVAFAKGFAYAAGKPLVCVNHLEGHLVANLLAQPDLRPPIIFTLVSGGHTMLVHVKAWGDYEVLGETLDDAVGEAVYQNPLILAGTYATQVTESKGRSIGIVKLYSTPDASPTSERDELNALFKRVASEITNDGMTPEQKAAAIDAWVCAHIDYDYDAFNASKSVEAGQMTNTERDQQYPHAWNATAVTTGKGVCMSYAYAFKGIADEAGLRSIVVLGNAYGDDGQGGAHAWNLVKASDGSWRTVDSTWNDNGSLSMQDWLMIDQDKPAQGYRKYNSQALVDAQIDSVPGYRAHME